MICHRCGAVYNQLVCPGCVERVNREAVLRAQPRFLENARAGSCDFTLARFQQHKPHIQLFRDPNRAFCGISLTNSPRRSQCTFPKLTPDSVCSQCFQVITDLLMGAAVK